MNFTGILLFHVLLENYAKHWCELLLNPNGTFSQCHSAVDPDLYYKVQWNVPVCLHFITFWWDCIRLKVFSVLCSDVFMLAVTVRRVRPACVPSSLPMHEFVHQRECSWQTGERTCAVWGIFWLSCGEVDDWWLEFHDYLICLFISLKTVK